MNYKILLFNNIIYIYNLKMSNVYKINADECIVDDKLNDVDKLELKFKQNNIVNKIINRLIPIKATFYYWENYYNVDLSVFKSFMSRFNIDIINFEMINKLFSKDTLIFSKDGIHFVGDNYLYYKYSLCGYLKEKTYDFIIQSNNVCLPTIVGDFITNNNYYYENNSTFFEDLLKT